MKTLERCQWHLFSVYIVDCEHIEIFLLIIDFEQTNRCWVKNKKISPFEDKLWYIKRYVIVI